MISPSTRRALGIGPEPRTSATATSVTLFPEELRDDALPYFIDWLLENVHLVEITAYSDDDAYTIFETMNDRGLSLTPRTCSRDTCLQTSTKPSAPPPTSAGVTASGTQRCWQGGRVRLFQGVAP